MFPTLLHLSLDRDPPPTDPNRSLIRVSLDLTASPLADPADSYSVTAITAGQANNYNWSPQVLTASVQAGLWDHVSVFINHANGPDTTRVVTRDLLDLAGIFHSPRFENDSIVGTLLAVGPRRPDLITLAETYLNSHAAGITPNIGLSADLYCTHDGPEIKQIVSVNTLDVVFQPAAGGEFLAHAPNAVTQPSPPDLTSQVNQIQNSVNHLLQTQTIRQNNAPIVVGPSPIEQLELSLAQWWGLAPKAQNDYAHVDRLRSFREFYTLATGDHEMRGIYDPKRVQLANATTTTMAELVRNVMNRVIATQWETLGRAGYLWWENIVHHQDFDSMQQIDWVTVGGFGDLPAISEGAAYTELTWNDSRETASWEKHGGFLGLTLEMIDRDAGNSIRALPVGLATAAIRTLSGEVADIFTDNSGVGPTLASDSTALFHADHSNLSTTAFSASEWDAIIIAMFKQTEFNSDKVLGIRPRFILGPIDIEKAALEAVISHVWPATNANFENVREGTATFLAVPEFTDTNDWAAVADPAVLPGIGVGYRFGRVPEVFVADSEQVGSMFTNDEMRLKVRFIFAVGVIDYRALHKANVS